MSFVFEMFRKGNDGSGIKLRRLGVGQSFTAFYLLSLIFSFCLCLRELWVMDRLFKFFD